MIVQAPDGPPLHLHARAITVPISSKGEPVRAEAPVTARMADALQRCGWEDAPAAPDRTARES